jgi:hypothetical protein
MSCSITSDCYSYDLQSDGGNINATKCGDSVENANCLCNGTTCVTMNCTDDTYCSTTFGTDSKCVNGSCTTEACETTDDCTSPMYCRNSICYAPQCSTATPCKKGSSCIDGYCTTDVFNYQRAIIILLILIFIIVVLVIVAYVMYNKYKAKKN